MRKKQFLILFHPLSQPPQCCLASEVSSIFVRTGTRLLLRFRNVSCSSGKTSPRLQIWIPRPHISRSRSMAFGTPFILGNFLIKGCWQYWDCCIPSVTGILSPPTWTISTSIGENNLQSLHAAFSTVLNDIQSGVKYSYHDTSGIYAQWIVFIKGLSSFMLDVGFQWVLKLPHGCDVCVPVWRWMVVLAHCCSWGLGQYSALNTLSR